LQNLHRATYYLERSFAGPRGKRKDDAVAGPLSPEDRCQRFFQHRADREDAVAVQKAIWNVLNLFGRDPANAAKRSGFAGSFTLDPLWSHLNTLTNKGQEIVTALRKVISQRTGDIAGAILEGRLEDDGGVAQDPDPGRLASHVSGLIETFPHNASKAPNIWRRTQQGARG
jgi:hypothetical protein